MSQKYGKKVRERMVDEMKEVFSGEQGFILSSVENLKASEIDVLRKNIKKTGGRYFVLKNRIADIALAQSGIEGLGPLSDEKKILGVGVVSKDPVETVKILKEFSKQKKGFDISAGYLEGRVITAERVNELADLPGREQLLAMLLGTMNAPVSGFVTALSGIVKSLLYAINAIKEKKES